MNIYAADGRKLMTKNATVTTPLNAPITECCIFDFTLRTYYCYNRKDHLGNIREVWQASNKRTIQRTQYYPSGLPWAEGLNPKEQPYKYNGKEWVEMHGLDEYDSEARWFYPAIMLIIPVLLYHIDYPNMKKNRIVVYGIFALILVVSCDGNNSKNVVSTDLVEKEKPNNETTIVKHSPRVVDISGVSVKMQKNNKLTTLDYDCICDFLSNNSDESKSEEPGYILFEYLKNKPLNNSAFLSYLSKKGTSQKEKLLTALIQIMCIDIGEENYSYGAFVKDFDMFSNSTSAKKAFNECMSNQ